MSHFDEQRLGFDSSNLLQAETEVGAQEEERAVEVHLVQRHHQIVDAAVGEIVQRLLLEASRERIRIRPRQVTEGEEEGTARRRSKERTRSWICSRTRETSGDSKRRISGAAFSLRQARLSSSTSVVAASAADAAADSSSSQEDIFPSCPSRYWLGWGANEPTTRRRCRLAVASLLCWTAGRSRARFLAGNLGRVRGETAGNGKSGGGVAAADDGVAAGRDGLDCYCYWTLMGM